MELPRPMKPRTNDWISIAGLALAILVFDGRLLGNRLPRGEDHWLAFLPAYRIGEHGWPPRWNPYVCGGTPHAANPQYSAWYPPRWVFCFASAVAAYGPYCFSHFLLAALAMFFCLRGLGCGRLGATIGALSFACGSYIQGHLSNPGLLISSVWLPLVVACTFRAIERPQLRWPALLGLLLAIVVFAGSPHNMFYATLIVGLVAVWEMIVGPVCCDETNSPVRIRLGRPIGHLALAGAVALGLSAVQWIPTAEFARLSFRHSLSIGDLARDPLAWNWLDNLFVGSPAPWATEYLDKSTYFGLSALPLLLLAVVVPQQRRREWFFVFLALVGVWISLGTQAGAFQLFSHLPVARFLSGPSRALVLFALGTSALVGFGADIFLRHNDWHKQIQSEIRNLKSKIERRFFQIVLTACAILAASLFLAKCWRMSWQDFVGIVVRATSPRDPSLFLAVNGAVFLALGVLLCSTGILLAKSLPKHGLGLAMALLLFLDLFHFRQRLPLPTAKREELAVPETAAAVVGDKASPFRVAGFEATRLNPGDTNDQSLREFLMPNLAALYGLQDIQGFDPLILADYVRLVEATAGRSPIDDPVRMLNIARPDSTLFRMLNVRYVMGDVRERAIAKWPRAQNGIHTIPLDRPTTLIGVSLVTLLDQAEDLADSAKVATVTAHGEGESRTAALLAGVQTADWRAADKRFPCHHRPARENMAWTLTTPIGPVRVANYYAQVIFDRPIVARTIEIRPMLPGVVFSVATIAAVLPEPPEWEKIYERDRYRVYRNRASLGGAWLVHRVRRAGDETEARDLLTQGKVDLAREAVIVGQTLTDSLRVGADAASTSPDRVEFVRYEADWIEVRTDSSQPAVLCFAEVFYPGWKAEVDGRPTGMMRVNSLLRGVALSTPGTHSVTLHFAPRSLTVGKMISAATFLVALALLASRLRFQVSRFKFQVGEGGGAGPNRGQGPGRGIT